MASMQSRIRYSALFLIVLLVGTFSVLLYHGVAMLLHNYADQRLLDLGENWAGFVEENTGTISEFVENAGPPLTPSLPAEEQRALREAVLSIRVLTLHGRLVWQGDAAVDRPPISPELLERVRHGETVYDTIYSASDPPIRRVSVPIPRQGEPRYVLQAETSLRFVESTLKGITGLLITFAALILAVAWVGTGWVTRKSLAPLEALSTTAEQISGSSMEKRLWLQAPYDEVRRLVQAFNAMMDRLQRVFEGQRRFVADAAHEIQTPLTVMRGNLEFTLQQERAATEYRDALIGNLKEVERLTGLTRSLLTLAQFAGNQPPVYLVPLQLAPVVSDVVSEFTLLAQERDIELRLEAQPVPRIMGDAGRLKQLLINLLNNALRYTSAQGTVTVQLQAAGGTVTLAVRDTGTGIAPAHLPHLFERFYRADSARARDTGGTGLGLAIVQEIVTAHRGIIRVESDEGKGTTFTIELPVFTSMPQR